MCLHCGACICYFPCGESVRAAGSGQVRPLPSALGRAPDFGSEHVHYHVATEFEKLACLHGQGVLDAEECRMAKRRINMPNLLGSFLLPSVLLPSG